MISHDSVRSTSDVVFQPMSAAVVAGRRDPATPNATAPKATAQTRRQSALRGSMEDGRDTRADYGRLRAARTRVSR